MGDIAQTQVDQANALSLMAEGSSVYVCRKRAEDWVHDRQVKDFVVEHFDVVVAELPFGVRHDCFKPERFFNALAAILRPETGRAALITPRGFARDVCSAADGSIWATDFIVRDGNVGGVAVQL